MSQQSFIKRYIVLCLLFTFCFSTVSSAHPGRTDSRGGHHDYSNGTYHYHHGYSAHQHPNGVCPYESPIETTAASVSVNTSITTSSTKDKRSSSTMSIFKFIEKQWFFIENCALLLSVSYCIYLSKSRKDILEQNKRAEEILSSVRADLQSQIDLCKDSNDTINSQKKEIEILKSQLSHFEIKDNTAYVLSQADAFRIAQVPNGVSFDIDNLPHYDLDPIVEKNMHVYISKNGKFYHRSKGCMQATIPIHLFTAAQFYSPCKCCIPSKAQDYKVPLWYYRYLQLACHCKISKSNDSGIRYQLSDDLIETDGSIDTLSE